MSSTQTDRFQFLAFGYSDQRAVAIFRHENETGNVSVDNLSMPAARSLLNQLQDAIATVDARDGS